MEQLEIKEKENKIKNIIKNQRNVDLILQKFKRMTPSSAKQQDFI